MSISLIAAEYAEGTEIFFAAVALITEDNIDRRPAGEWSARQIVHHVADSEAQSYARLRRLLAEPAGAPIQGYDEATWATTEALGYDTLPITHSLDVIRAVRTATLDIVQRLTTADLERWGVHTESGRYDVHEWASVYCHHPRFHAEQIREAITA